MPAVLPPAGAARGDPRGFEVVLVTASLAVGRSSLAKAGGDNKTDQRAPTEVQVVAGSPPDAERTGGSRRSKTMTLTDPVADMLTRVRNALQARHQKVDIPASRLKLEIARILKEEGYVSNFKATEEEGHKVIRIYLKYGAHNEAAISKAERV